MKLIRTDDLERLEDCIPIINMVNGVDRQKIFDLEMKLSGWHHHYNLHKIKEEVRKMEELLGTATFKGKSIPDYEIDFFIKQHIWAYTMEDDEDCYIALYLNEEGLSVEVSDECEPYLVEILEELIQMIIQ